MRGLEIGEVLHRRVIVLSIASDDFPRAASTDRVRSKLRSLCVVPVPGRGRTPCPLPENFRLFLRIPWGLLASRRPNRGADLALFPNQVREAMHPSARL